MVMPCSRSARSPSVSSEKSISPPRIADFNWSSYAPLASCSSRPISVLLPSSTLPAVVRRSRPLDFSPARNCSTSKDCGEGCSTAADISSEVPFSFLQFHGSFAVMVDHPVLALRIFHCDQLGDDLGQRVGLRADRAGARRASQRPHPAFHRLEAVTQLRFHEVLLGHDQ